MAKTPAPKCSKLHIVLELVMATQWLHFRLAADKHAGNNNGDKIEKTIDLKASVEHVSRALTNHVEFGSGLRRARKTLRRR